MPGGAVEDDGAGVGLSPVRGAPAEAPSVSPLAISKGGVIEPDADLRYYAICGGPHEGVHWCAPGEAKTKINPLHVGIPNVTVRGPDSGIRSLQDAERALSHLKQQAEAVRAAHSARLYQNLDKGHPVRSIREAPRHSPESSELTPHARGARASAKGVLSGEARAVG